MGITGDNAKVLQEVPKVLRALLAENEKLASALAVFRVREEAETIVAEMDARGISDPDAPFSEKVAALLSSKKDLRVVKEAMALVSPNSAFASLSSHHDVDDDSTAKFEQYLLGFSDN